MKRSVTIRYLVGAWLTVAAIVALAYFFKPDSQPLPPQVDAAYERMPARRLPQTDARAPAEVPAELGAAPVASEAATAAAVSSFDYQPPAGEARVFGCVRSRDSRAPVADVRLRLRQRDGWHVWAARSGVDGGYAFEGVPGGAYVLVAGGGEADVIEEVARRAVAVGDGGSARVDVLVRQGGRVWGRVVDAAGRPIEGAKVIVGTSESIVTQFAKAARKRQVLGGGSDAEGNYVVSGVPFEREWKVWVDKDDLAPLLTPGFVLHPSRPHLRMDVTLLAGTTIRGRVVTPAGRGIPGAELTCVPRYSAFLSPMHRARTARTTRSERDGCFALTGLPAGDYQVLGFREGYRIALQGKPVYPDGRSDIHGFRVVLQPAMGEGSHVVFGRVVDAAGAPLADAHVGLAAFGAQSLSFGGTDTRTAADGSFRFEGLAKQGFVLVVGKQGYRQATLERVALDTRLEVALAAQASVSGVVRVPAGAARPRGFSVRIVRVERQGKRSLLDSLSGRRRQGFSHERGEFALRDVPPGRVLLEASAAGFAPARREVTVPEGEAVAGVVLELSAEGAEIRGRVVDSRGAPVAGATVRALEAGGAGGLLGILASEGRDLPEATTGEDGSYALEKLADATYEVRVEHPDHAPGVLPGVNAQAGQPAAQADVTLRSGGTVAGVARPGVMVTLAGEGFSKLAATGEDGSFQVEKVPPGSYLARAVITSEEDPTRAPRVYRQRVVVREGLVSELDFVKAPAGRRVRGQLQPQPREGELGMVLLMVKGAPPPDPDALLWQGQVGVSDPQAGRFVVAEALTDAAGRYELQDVPPGRYVVYAYLNSVLRGLTGEGARLVKREEIEVD